MGVSQSYSEFLHCQHRWPHAGKFWSWFFHNIKNQQSPTCKNEEICLWKVQTVSEKSGTHLLFVFFLFLKTWGNVNQVISNDQYKSVLHRAVVNCNKDRISIPTFYCPSPDAVIGPSPELVDDDHPAVYRNFTCEEYYTQFWNRGLATESCLDTFKASTTWLFFPASFWNAWNVLWYLKIFFNLCISWVLITLFEEPWAIRLQIVKYFFILAPVNDLTTPVFDLIKFS